MNFDRLKYEQYVQNSWTVNGRGGVFVAVPSCKTIWEKIHDFAGSGWPGLTDDDIVEFRWSTCLSVSINDVHIGNYDPPATAQFPSTSCTCWPIFEFYQAGISVTLVKPGLESKDGYSLSLVDAMPLDARLHVFSDRLKSASSSIEKAVNLKRKADAAFPAAVTMVKLVQEQMRYLAATRGEHRLEQAPLGGLTLQDLDIKNDKEVEDNKNLQELMDTHNEYEKQMKRDLQLRREETRRLAGCIVDRNSRCKDR